MSRILFIDDDFFTLETYQKIVSFLGHEAIVAETGADALELAQKGGFDLIVLDRQLPDMDGFQILQQLRSTEKALLIPVVMVSASHSVFAKRAIAEGAQEFICKPLLTDDLKNLIDRYSS